MLTPLILSLRYKSDTKWVSRFAIHVGSIIAEMSYIEKASQEELLEMLPHRRKLWLPEAITNKDQR